MKCNNEELLPAYLRKTGKISSLKEFQQRVERQNSKDEKICSNIQSKDNYSNDNIQNIHMNENHLIHNNIQNTHVPYEEIRSPSINSSFSSFYRTNRIRSKHTNGFFGLDDSFILMKKMKDSKEEINKNKKILKERIRLLLFLVTLGFISGFLSYGLKKTYASILGLRLNLVNYTNNSYFLSYLIWNVHTILFVLLSIYWTNKISKLAIGSSIPQMKTILTGIDSTLYLPGYFTLATFFSKFGGIIFAVGSGLIIGTEGAFIHMLSILTTQLLRLRIFHTFRKHETIRYQLLAAACASGVAANFSTPIGGVLFSIEVTSTYYLISNYWKAFVASVTGAVIYQLSYVLFQVNHLNGATSYFQIIKPVYATNFPMDAYYLWELPLFVILGIILGVVSGTVIYMVEKIAILRFKINTKSSCLKFISWLDPLVVALLTGSLTFIPGNMVRTTPMDTINNLFSVNSTAVYNNWYFSPYFSSDVYAFLCIFFVYVFLFPLSFSLKMPTGAWLPMFVAGAAFGRLYGEVLKRYFVSSIVYPGGYALVGAVCLSGGVTSSVSSAVIAMEMTGQLVFLVPIFISLLSCIGIHSLMQMSIYDTMLIILGLPYLPLLAFKGNKKNSDKNKSVKDILDKSVVFLTKKTNLMKMLMAVNRLPGHSIPVISSRENPVLLGIVSSHEIKVILRYYYKKYNLQNIETDLLDNKQENHKNKKKVTYDNGEIENRHLKTKSDNNILPTFAINNVSWKSLKVIFNEEDHIHGKAFQTFDRIQSFHQAIQANVELNEHIIKNSNQAIQNKTKRRKSILRDESKLEIYLASQWSEQKKYILNKLEIQLKTNCMSQKDGVTNETHENEGKCQIQPMPITVSIDASLEDVHIIFTMLRCDHCYVTNQGKLEGVITTKSIIDAGKSKY